MNPSVTVRIFQDDALPEDWEEFRRLLIDTVTDLPKPAGLTMEIGFSPEASADNGALTVYPPDPS